MRTEACNREEDSRQPWSLGCRIGNARHLLCRETDSRTTVARALRQVPGLEPFLVEGVNRASVGRERPAERVEDVLARWGYRRTERAVSAFERRLFRRS